MKPKFIEASTLSPEIHRAIEHALTEDVDGGDVTTDSIVPRDALMTGQIIAKQAGIVAGLDVAAQVFRRLDARVQVEARVEEGARVEKHQTPAIVSGPARALLTGERAALNFLGRISGIATLTRQFVDAVAGTHALILDARKSAPGLRAVDKLAVGRVGGENHL